MNGTSRKGILIVHALTLQDSGSCVFVRNLAMGFQRLGYHVTIACQDNDADKIEGIGRKTEDAYFLEDDKITAFLPISPFKGHILPNMVYNPYEGYIPKVMTEMSIEEGEGHVELVSRRLADLIAAHNFDYIISNHCLFSPVNVKRALDICAKDIPHCVQIHGSALNFIAAKDKRWLPYVYEGLRSAKNLICSTDYMKTRLNEVLIEALPRVELIPCGVDTTLFSGFERISEKRRFNVVYVGAILNTKGIGELLLVMPHIKERHPNIHFHIIGAGTYEPNLKGMIEAINKGDVGQFEKHALQNNFVADYVNIKQYFMKADTGFITFHGFKTHDVLAPFLSNCDVMVIPSKHPEAFGLVTIEALASGVLPVVANHSGLGNVIDLISTHDASITECMRIHYPNGNIDIGNVIKAVSNAIEFVENDSDIGAKLKCAASHFKWINICDEIIN